MTFNAGVRTMKTARMLLLCFLPAAMSVRLAVAQTTLFVSPAGNDSGSGDIAHPVRTIGEALDRAGRLDDDVTIFLRKGTYVLDHTETIDKARIGDKRLTLSAYGSESVTVTAAVPLDLRWKRRAGGIWSARCANPIDQLYINGRKCILARYPDWTPDVLFNGTSAEALSKDRVAKWKHPEGGYIHSMHSGKWGSKHYVITGRIRDSLTYVGGNQVSRPSPIHKQLTFVENIREELDSPGEWFLDKDEAVLYYYPLPGEKLHRSKVEAVFLHQPISVSGLPGHPLKGLSIEGIRFSCTARMFMLPYETLMRSDWGIWRGGAVTLRDTEDCCIKGCEFTDLGGNAVFIDGYAFRDTVMGNHIHQVGGSAVCLVGDTSAVRSGAYGYYDSVAYDKLDKEPGPRKASYPRECLVEDNLIHHLGTVEKQVAGVEMQIAAGNVIRHNTIFDVPRAGINIGDGAFGGHIIEHNDVFDTVLETSDHGAFNSWGRDRFWLSSRPAMNALVEEHPELILLDAVEPTVIRYNRFRCDHGWDIDLDDGSSNYHIYANLCLHGGIKLREGFFRTVENNYVINNTLHPHVWFKDSHDIVRHNVFMRPYAPVMMKSWGDEIDYNFFIGDPGERALKTGTDRHSVWGEVKFSNPANGNYSILSDSDLSAVGIEDIPMEGFGVYSPDLLAIARQPVFPSPFVFTTDKHQKTYSWQGATIRSISGLGDRSAFGLPDEKGAIILSVTEDSPAMKAGLIPGDVILSLNGHPAEDAGSLLSLTSVTDDSNPVKVGIFRYQKQLTRTLRIVPSWKKDLPQK